MSTDDDRVSLAAFFAYFSLGGKVLTLEDGRKVTAERYLKYYAKLDDMGYTGYEIMDILGE